jgi:pyridoxamine 5'-phosphate oxidase
VGERDELRDVLRGLPVFHGIDLPVFEPQAAPTSPDDLFVTWFQDAIDAGVSEPHVATLSTVDADGRPNARVLLLKTFAAGRWGFATSRGSRKGIELDGQPWAALTFYWRELGRQIRVRGRALDAGPQEAARDFRARSPAARAESWGGRQSQVLFRADDLHESLIAARSRVESQPEAVPDHWVRYDVVADEVEFWQADADRRHTRLRYELRAGSWTRRELWP